MELSCESVRCPEERRPVSCKFVELHVLYVPDDQWNVKLNKVPAEAIESFISAGFIRVFPDVTLKSLRRELGSLLGADKSINKFSFLKCVGRSLALVKGKQEKDLKVKTFAPPYAPQPELYLLPAVETGSSVCSRSLSPDTSSSSPDQPTYYHSAKTCSLPTRIKEPVKFPLIPQSSQPPPPTPSLEEEEEEEEEEHSYSSLEGHEEDVSSNRPEWPEQECCQRTTRNQRTSQLVSLNKESPEKEESSRRKKPYHRKVTGDSGVAESLEDAESSFSPADGQRKLKEGPSLKPTSEPTRTPAVSSPLVQCVSPPPPGPDVALVPHKTAAPPLFQTNREELIEEIKLVREERKQLEWTRQELLRKGKDLLAQNRHRRNQARDGWKKKYFETKKATAPLEENLRKLRQELETFYNKLLHQLQARDHRGKPRRHGRTSIKNELIIQIMTESHEIDDLKRKIEDAKMKLVTEIKLRKQAATELRALKAELAQKKSQWCLLGPAASLGFGHTTRVRTKDQNTSV